MPHVKPSGYSTAPSFQLWFYEKGFWKASVCSRCLDTILNAALFHLWYNVRFSSLILHASWMDISHASLSIISCDSESQTTSFPSFQSGILVPPPTPSISEHHHQVLSYSDTNFQCNKWSWTPLYILLHIIFFFIFS
jgi:hypothetical protein